MVKKLAATLVFSSFFAVHCYVQAEEKFPDICNLSEARAAANQYASELYGKCMEVEHKMSQFGYPKKDFKQSDRFIFKCSKKSYSEILVGQLADARTKKCDINVVKEARLSGQYCGLTNEVSDQWKSLDSESLDLSTATAAELKKLSRNAQIQIFVAVRELIEDAKPVKSVAEAVKLLADSSEGGDVYYETFTYRGQKFNQVLTYPGGNGGGVIFKAESAKIHATNGDGSILCAL